MIRHEMSDGEILRDGVVVGPVIHIIVAHVPGEEPVQTIVAAERDAKGKLWSQLYRTEAIRSEADDVRYVGGFDPGEATDIFGRWERREPPWGEVTEDDE
jgi:hypothetical protein